MSARNQAVKSLLDLLTDYYEYKYSLAKYSGVKDKDMTLRDFMKWLRTVYDPKDDY